MSNSTQAVPATGYLRQWQIIGNKKRNASAPILDISSATLWRWVNDPKTGFPKPRKLSAGVTAWRAEEVHAWLAARSAK